MTIFDCSLQVLGNAYALLSTSTATIVFSCAAILMGNSVSINPANIHLELGKRSLRFGIIAGYLELFIIWYKVLVLILVNILSHIQRFKEHSLLGLTLLRSIFRKRTPSPHHQFLGFFGGKASAIVTEYADLEQTARKSYPQHFDTQDKDQAQLHASLLLVLSLMFWLIL